MLMVIESRRWQMPHLANGNIWSCLSGMRSGFSRIVIQSGGRRPAEGIRLRIGLRQERDVSAEADRAVGPQFRRMVSFRVTTALALAIQPLASFTRMAL